jgi:hypothetical protein
MIKHMPKHEDSEVQGRELGREDNRKHKNKFHIGSTHIVVDISHSSHDQEGNCMEYEMQVVKGIRSRTH